MKIKHEYTISEIDELRSLAVKFLETLPEHAIICLEAEMGAGKTTFTQFVLQAMGIEHPEGSPTYSIVNEYFSPKYGKVFHLDLYRTDTEEELYDIGLEEIIYGDSIAFIEWPSRAVHLLPDNIIYLYIKRNINSSRTFTWETEIE